VRLPATESLTTMFWPLVSASNCSTDPHIDVLEVQGEPFAGIFLLSSALDRFREGLISMVYWLSD